MAGNEVLKYHTFYLKIHLFYENYIVLHMYTLNCYVMNKWREKKLIEHAYLLCLLNEFRK